MSHLHKEDLYFLTPCGKFSLVFNNNKVYILSRNLFILNEFDIQFDFHQQKYDKRYCRGKTSVLWFQKYNSVILNGQIFVQCFDKIYTFGAQNQFAELCRVPDLDLSTYESFYGKLFTINNQLMLANNNKLYTYQQFFTEIRDLNCNYIADWCGVVVFLNENKVCQLLEDYSVKIIGTTNTSTLVVFCGAGTLILQSASGLDLYIVDLVNIQLHKINNTYQPNDTVDQLSLSKIKNSLVIGDFGLQLTTDKLELIGPEFWSQIKEKFIRYHQNKIFAESIQDFFSFDNIIMHQQKKIAQQYDQVKQQMIKITKSQDELKQQFFHLNDKLNMALQLLEQLGSSSGQ
ncbi:Conserved_hypothetical protein [Hexamita inflata]|uniref:Uncharacterized protein n=1 Tax=Hexamita inflata TaxID=28002 RepID=A0AA86NIK6_9EUKA|nr:Conserved hypothetical protein [Hexamita inflata]CAI9919958.1 Conserved hypothetical protein [Hexamita inflata]CAI9971971.1 Conserved hypothetical protein [Hexamita inflata]